MFGTDTGVSAHGDNAQEFVWMVEAGMPAMDAIKSATIVPAKFMGADDRYGTVQAGKVADLVAVPGDPLADITVLQDKGRILSVMKDGVFHREPPVGAQRLVLDARRFGMLQRHVEEDPLDRRQGGIRAVLDAGQAALQRHLVLGKGRRAAAVDVPGELVEQQDERQQAVRAVGPGIELAAGGERGEVLADRVEEGKRLGVEREPLAGVARVRGALPVDGDCFCRDWLRKLGLRCCRGVPFCGAHRARALQLPHGLRAAHAAPAPLLPLRR
jgi:hypothetical protein